MIVRGCGAAAAAADAAAVAAASASAAAAGSASSWVSDPVYKPIVGTTLRGSDPSWVADLATISGIGGGVGLAFVGTPLRGIGGAAFMRIPSSGNGMRTIVTHSRHSGNIAVSIAIIVSLFIASFLLQISDAPYAKSAKSLKGQRERLNLLFTMVELHLTARLSMQSIWSCSLSGT